MTARSIGGLKATVTAETRPYEEGMSRARKANKDTVDAIKKGSATTAHVIEQNGRKFTVYGRTVQSALNKQNRAYASAVRSIDPASTALERYLRHVTAIRNANRLGQISQARMTQQIRLAKQAYYDAAAGAKAFAVAGTRGMGSTRSMGNAIQQAGFQVGDFAVQVASGQGVLRPFIQQGTQLVSMFGPMGAVIGAVGATLGAVATAFITSGDAAEDAAGSVERLREAQQALNDTLGIGRRVANADIAVKLRQAEAANALARSEVALLEVETERARANLKSAERRIQEGGGLGAVFAASGQDRTLTALTEKLGEWNIELDQSELNIENLRRELEFLGAGQDEATSSINETVVATEKLSTKWREAIEVNNKVTMTLKNQAAALVDLDGAVREGNALRAATRTDAENLAIEEARLNKLRQLGVIDQETLNRAMEDAREKYKDTATVAARVGDILSKSTDSWVDKIVDGSFKAKDAIKLLLGELTKLAASQAFLALVGRDGSKLGESSSAFGSALTSSISGLLGFQNGAQFQVGGQGGTDSQLVAFRATPNETVSVTKPGQSMGSGTVINMDLRGAEVGVEQRVKAVVSSMFPDIATYTQNVMGANQTRNKLGGRFK